MKVDRVKDLPSDNHTGGRLCRFLLAEESIRNLTQVSLWGSPNWQGDHKKRRVVPESSTGS